MDLAPILLFVYNRPDHTLKTLESLAANFLADRSQLFIYADGARHDATPDELARIKKVRAVIREKKWCGQVEIVELDKNRDLPNLLISTVTDILNRYGKIIVLEDDLFLTQGFLQYMNDALTLYKDNESVMQISGYSYPLKTNLPEYYFTTITYPWGWGTWKRAWDHFNPSAGDLLNMFTPSAIARFTFNGVNLVLMDLLKKSAKGPRSNWDARWEASVFLKNGLVLCPYPSLVRNIGHDNSGLNCGPSVVLSQQSIGEYKKLIPVKIEENKKARKALRRFMKNGGGARQLSFMERLLKWTIPPYINGLFDKQKTVLPSGSFKNFMPPVFFYFKGKERIPEKLSVNAYIDYENELLGHVSVISMEMKNHLLEKNKSAVEFTDSKGYYGIAQDKDDIIKTCGFALSENIEFSKDPIFDYSFSVFPVHYLNDMQLNQFISGTLNRTGKMAVYFIHTSYNRKDHGFIYSGEFYRNNSIHWWVEEFLKYYPRVSFSLSAWDNSYMSASRGAWFICEK